MRYIMILYHTDANYIFSNSMRNRNEAQILKTHEKIVMQMKTEGLGTKKHVVDNDISKSDKAAIKSNGATLKLVPSGEHRHIIAKKSIQTQKNHFVWVLAGLHESFTMHLCCQFLPQAEIQLNLQQKIYHQSQGISLCTCPRPPQFYAQASISFGVPCIGT